MKYECRRCAIVVDADSIIVGGDGHNYCQDCYVKDMMNAPRAWSINHPPKLRLNTVGADGVIR